MAFFSAAISLLLLSVSSPCVHGSVVSTIDCSAEIAVNMASCLPFMAMWSRMDKPGDWCCYGVKRVLDKDPDCLCQGLKDSRFLGFVFNATKASTLPSLCNLTPCGLSTPPPPPPAASAPAPVPAAGSRQGSASVKAPSPSGNNHGSSLIPISGLSFVISGALVLLFSRL